MSINEDFLVEKLSSIQNGTKETIINELTEIFIKENVVNEINEIGKIYISAAPLSEHLFIPCDGRKIRKLDPKYRKLYAVIGDRYSSDYNSSITNTPLSDAEFCVPDMRDRAMIMQDPSGLIDDVRDLGSNAEWSINTKQLESFDLDNQTSIVVNDLLNQDEYDPDENGYTSFTEPGNHVFVTKEYNKFKIKPNGYSGESVRLGEKLRFDSKYVNFYIRYRNIEDLSSDELASLK